LPGSNARAPRIIGRFNIPYKTVAISIVVRALISTKEDIISPVKGDRLGEFEELTLLAAMALAEPTYAVPVQSFVEEAADRRVSLGAIYAVLARLETKGFVESWLGEATARRGGKSKRLYRVTPLGLKTARVTHLVRERIWQEIRATRG
jgi:PadR family transcriptional regulator PadR